MAILAFNFDNARGSAITIGNGTNDSGSGNAFDTITIGTGCTMQYDNTHAYGGGQYNSDPAGGSLGTFSAKCATGSTSTTCFLQWSSSLGTQTNHYGHIYLYFTANPGTAFRVVSALSGASAGCRVRVNTSGKIELSDQAGTIRATSTNSISLNQWIRLDWNFIHSTTAGQVTVNLYNSPDSTSATETVQTANNINTLASIDTIRFGVDVSTANIGPFWMDNIIAGVTSGYPDVYPVNSAVPTISGSSVAGSTLTATTGTWNASPTISYQWARLKDTNDLKFNGSTDYAEAPDSSTLQVESTGAFSLASWIYVDSSNNNVLPRIAEKGAQYLAIMGDSTNGMYQRIALAVTNNSSTESEYWSTLRLQSGQWYHVVTTFNAGSGTCTMYINGVSETINNITAWTGTLLATSGNDFYLGRRHTDLTRNFQGRIKDFLVYQRAVNSGEALAIFNGSPPNDYTARWRASEGAGTTLYDDSSNHNNSTITGSTWETAAPYIPIASATASTYVITNPGDDGYTILVDVLGANTTTSNSAVLVPSSATATVTLPVPSNTVAPVVSGTANIGNTLTTTTGTWTNTPSSYTYQWQRDNAGGGSYSNITPAYRALVLTDSPGIFLLLNETSGSAAADSSGNGRSGTYTGGFTLNQASLTGYTADASVALNGSTGYVSTAYNPFTVGGAQTFEGWANRTDTSARHPFFSGGGGTGPIMLAAVSGSTDISFWPDTGLSQVTWTAACPTATNFLWTLTYDDNINVAELFINGVSKGTRSTAAYDASGGNTLFIGEWVSSNFWKGSLSNFAVYPYVLSSTNIANHYTVASSNILLHADVGNKVRCVVTAHNSGGGTAANSNATSRVTGPVLNLVAPVITGDPFIGENISTSDGTWEGYPIPTITYQWQRSPDNVTFSDIGLMTTNTYSIVSGDRTYYLRCAVTASN
jgi:hypothetical protein